MHVGLACLGCGFEIGRVEVECFMACFRPQLEFHFNFSGFAALLVFVLCAVEASVDGFLSKADAAPQVML